MSDRRSARAEARSRLRIAWLARMMRDHGRTQFLLEDLQPTWLRRTGSYFFLTDTLLGAAIGVLVAPLAIVIPVYFGTGSEAAFGSTMLAAVSAGAVLGALGSGKSARLAAKPPERPADGPPPDDVPHVPPADEVQAESTDATVVGNERVTGSGEPAEKKGCSNYIGCVFALKWAIIAGIFIVGGILWLLNWFASSDFVQAVGLGNALAVLFTLIATLLYARLERRRLRSTGRFIRPAEAIGWSPREGLRDGLLAALLGALIAYPSARLLDGWLGNRPRATIGIRTTGIDFDGALGMGEHFLGLSEQGMALLLFIWMAIVVAGVALGGLRSRFVNVKTLPNQGIRLSARNALLCLFAVGTPTGTALGIGLYFMPTWAATLPFTTFPTPIPVEILAARLQPSIQRFIDGNVVLAQRVAFLTELEPGARQDSLRAWAVRAEQAADYAAKVDSFRVMAYIRRSVDGLDVGELSRELAGTLADRRYAYVPWEEWPVEVRARSARFSAVAGRTRDIVADFIALDRDVAGSPAAVERLFGPVPPDSMPASMRAEADASGAPFGLGFVLGLAIGGLAALLNGGMAVIRHYVLRLFLAAKGHAPLDYAQFLDGAVDRLGFLERVGGGYMFIHRMLLEHFAEEWESVAT